MGLNFTNQHLHDVRYISVARISLRCLKAAVRHRRQWVGSEILYY